MNNQPLRPTEEPLRELAETYLQAGQGLHLGILDDVAVRVRDLTPDADRLAVCLTDDGDLHIHGIWSAPSAQLGERRVLVTADTAGPDTVLALTEITSDLEMVVPSLYLQTWGLEHTRPCEEHGCCSWVTLPPANRLATLTTLVHAHIPDAEALVCPVERHEEKVLVGFDRILRAGGEPVPFPCPGCAPNATRPWPLSVTWQLIALLGQIYALPHLRSRHMTPCLNSASEHGVPLWQITLPWQDHRPVAAAAAH
ncbi:hypothetical protein ACFCYF_23700 [Streptomyces chartreusis]|uniref:hypothetical protein n=1 Tax=Streptomyces chartreusis TaxID=1969 RepID=UPI0035DB9710